jgi:hypothetical protein
MIAENKAKADLKQDQMAAVEAETQDEIDQIMSEIEELQQEMNAAAAPKLKSQVPTTPTPAVAPASVAPPVKLQVVEPTPETLELEAKLEAELAAEIEPSATIEPQTEAILAEAIEPDLGIQAEEPISAAQIEQEQSLLKEFTGEGEEPWLEETLAHLKQEPELTEQELAVEQEVQEMIQAEQTQEAETGVDDLIESMHEAETKNETESMNITEAMDETESIHEPAPRGETGSAGGSLSMSVTGNMTIQLNYQPTGHSVSVGFSSDWIHLKLADGTELKIPLKKKSGKKGA